MWQGKRLKTYGISCIWAQVQSGEKSIIVGNGINSLAEILRRSAAIKDADIPSITRKELTWDGVRIVQYPKKQIVYRNLQEETQ